MYDNMKKLCSGSPTISPQSDLRCEYNFKNSPFLTIAPLKEELLSSNPKIVLFHDVIYDSEIEKLVKEAARKVRRINFRKFNSQYPILTEIIHQMIDYSCKRKHRSRPVPMISV